MKKLITVSALLAVLASAAFAVEYDTAKYEPVIPDFDIDWTADYDYYDFSTDAVNTGSGFDNDMGCTLVSGYWNTFDKSGDVVGGDWFFNANSDYLIFFKMTGVDPDEIAPSGHVFLYLSGYYDEDPDEIRTYAFDDVFGLYRAGLGNDGTAVEGDFTDILTDFFENGAYISYRDLADQHDNNPDLVGFGWQDDMYENYPDGNFRITAVRAEIVAKAVPDPERPGYNIRIIDTNRQGRIYLSLVKPIETPEVPEPAAYAYGVMGLVSLIGMKKRFGK